MLYIDVWYAASDMSHNFVILTLYVSVSRGITLILPPPHPRLTPTLPPPYPRLTPTLPPPLPSSYPHLTPPKPHLTLILPPPHPHLTLTWSSPHLTLVLPYQYPNLTLALLPTHYIVSLRSLDLNRCRRECKQISECFKIIRLGRKECSSPLFAILDMGRN